MSLYIASDHAGFSLKNAILAHCLTYDIPILDEGPFDPFPVDYPDYAQKIVGHILKAEAGHARGILICGTGIGMCIAANRFSGIRAAVCHSEYEARSARQHNAANVLCLGARVLGVGQALACVDVFCSTSFEGARHVGRIEKIETNIGM